MENSPYCDLISVDRVLELHGMAIERYGGDGTVRDADKECVLGALGGAWNAALYREPEEATRGLCFVAHILVYLNRRHCFIDGNKRVAWLAAVEICQAKRLTLAATADEAESLLHEVITQSLEPDDVISWLAGRLVWIE